MRYTVNDILMNMKTTYQTQTDNNEIRIEGIKIVRRGLNKSKNCRDEKAENQTQYVNK